MKSLTRSYESLKQSAALAAVLAARQVTGLKRPIETTDIETCTANAPKEQIYTKKSCLSLHVPKSLAVLGFTYCSTLTEIRQRFEVRRWRLDRGAVWPFQLVSRFFLTPRCPHKRLNGAPVSHSGSVIMGAPGSGEAIWGAHKMSNPHFPSIPLVPNHTSPPKPGAKHKSEIKHIRPVPDRVLLRYTILSRSRVNI